MKKLTAVVTFIFLLFVGSGVALATTDVEPNDSNEEAVSVKFDSEGSAILDGISHHSSWYDGNDYYRIILDSDGIISVQNFSYLSETVNVSIYDQDGDYIQSADTKLGSPGTYEHLFEVGLAKGTYYLIIDRDKGDFENGSAYNLKINYTINQFFEKEPNDNSALATPIQLNKKYQAWMNINDDDIFYFEVKEPGEINLEFPYSVNNRYSILIYDVEYNYIVSQITVLNSNLRKDTLALGLDKGSYILQISDYDIVKEEKYDFTLNYKPSSTIELEPNNDMNQASPLILETKYKGIFERDGDYDYYRFTVDSNGKYDFNISQSTSHVYSLYLYDDEGNLIESGTTPLSASNLANLFTVELEPGTYFVSTEAYQGVPDNVPYEVSISKYVQLISYKDLKSSHWAYKQVMYLADASIIGGYPDGTFQPNRNTTRAEAARMLASALNLEVVDTPSIFKDVASSHWANDYIVAAAKAGVFKGNPDGTFNPSGKLTRAEMATLLSTAYDLTAKKPAHFSDVKATHWANQSIAAMYENNLTVGYPDGTYRPSNPTTRAEFSMFLAKALNPDFR